jgi:hypothetical protein
MDLPADVDMRRKRYAMYRLGLAMKRLLGAASEAERIMATRWVNAWSRAVGERRFGRFARGLYGSDVRRTAPLSAPRSHDAAAASASVDARGPTLQ